MGLAVGIPSYMPLILGRRPGEISIKAAKTKTQNRTKRTKEPAQQSTTKARAARRPAGRRSPSRSRPPPSLCSWSGRTARGPPAACPSCGCVRQSSFGDVGFRGAGVGEGGGFGCGRQSSFLGCGGCGVVGFGGGGRVGLRATKETLWGLGVYGCGRRSAFGVCGVRGGGGGLNLGSQTHNPTPQP